ncbi:hypothetical protein CFN78_13995 [Amycolatopsis antarctica]|uniref:Uncharacterized protein n=1 Tax=Amycolatopsis antarctica TaxID=1854586 RepID=A0A263D3D6_9PSEU|nr:hypothetical protein [Amycolatopsis antarctica]OZM72729.1 hypothetical protein CFN78_13995 [Amycolatopsis antarctica]
MSSAPVPRPAPWRWWLVLGALVCATAGFFAAVNPGRLVLLHAAAPFGGLLLASVPVLVAAALFAHDGHPVTRRLLPAVLATLGVLGAAASWLLSGGRETSGQSVVATSEDERLQIVRIRTGDADPVDELVLRSSEGLLSQRDELGCFRPDGAGRSFAAARFLADDLVQVLGGNGESWTLAVDGPAVRMRDRLPPGAC